MSPPAAHDPDSPSSLEFLDTAHRIGARLVQGAHWADETCTWDVMVPDATGQSRDSVPERATGLFYQGSSGIAWFLGQLARHTDDADVRRTAVGGMEHALSFAASLPPQSFGLHSGRLGVAWAAARLAQCLDRPQWRQEALELIEPLQGKASQDGGLDVIAGAAGAVPALLDLYALFGQPSLLELARDLGDHLMTQAHHDLTGWSWATLPHASYRNLNGLAHGASGIGLALLELAMATGDGRYRFGAEMAFLYERSCYDGGRKNWPDLRNQPLSEMYQFGLVEQLKERVRRGRAPAYRPTYMTAWCHGSPGIGLARLRAWELTGQDIYLQEAKVALQSTDASLDDEALAHTNYSLCHGASGNAELLLHGARQLDDAHLLERCHQVARRGHREWEEGDAPWPCGTMDTANDPSLLIGEAGIGSFYLRLVDPSVPSPLLLRPAYEERALPTDGYAEAADRAMDAFVGRSRRRWHTLTQGAFQLPTIPPGDVPCERPPAVVARQAMGDFLEACGDGDLAALLEDAWSVERAAMEAQHGLHDFTAESLRTLARLPWSEVPRAEVRFARAPHLRLVTTQFHWQAWDAEATSDAPDAEAPSRQETCVVLHRQQQRLVPQPVGRLAAVLLELLEEPSSLNELIHGIAEAVGADDPAAVAPTVEQQLAQLYVADFVDVEGTSAQ